MTLVVPDGGEDIILAYVVNKDSPEDLVLRLFTNNITPGESDEVGDYTEASGNGYASIELAGASWTVSGGASYAQQTFTFTGALGDVYGYYMTRKTSGELVWAERFSGAPFNIANNGDQIKITPTISAS